MNKQQRVTDTARLDWIADNRAETEYITGKVGPGWIRHEGWRVSIKNVITSSGDTLRQATDAAMKLKSEHKEQP